MKKLIAYCRVSTERQKSTRNGLEAQRAEIMKFAQTHNYEVIEVVEEAVSGTYDLRYRPVLKAAIDRANKIGATLIVSKIDRLSRKASFVMNLMDTKLKFIVAELGEDTTPFMLHIHLVVAEQEAKVIGARTKVALEAKKVREPNWKAGNPTNLHIVARKGAKATAELADMFAESMKPLMEPLLVSGMSLRQVAAALNKAEKTTVRGKEWTAQTVANLRARW